MDSTARQTTPLGRLDLIPPLDEVQGRYRVRFATTQADLDAICRLRFEVFNLELGEGLEESYETGRDEDRFDPQCQHLMVLHESSGEVVGTYRLQVSECALAGEGFYSQGEFDLTQLPDEVLADSIELGRACIAREHRSRKVLFLLWKGLTAYVTFNERRYFFGCSSLTSQDAGEGRRAYLHILREGHLHPTLCAPPHPGFECIPAADLSRAAAEGESLPLPSDEPVKIPTLFAIYLRYGAKVLGPPALDREFKTIDFLTLLDVRAMDEDTFRTFAR